MWGRQMVERRSFIKISIAAAAGGIAVRALCDGARPARTDAPRIEDATVVPCFGGGWRMYAFTNRTTDIMLSTLFRSPSGKLVMVDGGWGLDGDFLQPVLKRLGGVVDTWFLTHAHRDHYGALWKILKKPDCGGVNIGRVVHSFLPVGFLAATEKACAVYVDEFMRDLANSGLAVEKPSAGCRYDFGEGLSFECLNDYDLSMRRDAVNNSSICYRVVNNGKSILVTGDVSVEMGAKMLATLPAEKLRSDICFMAHHGQAGADKRFYAAVMPEMCIWPTPQWLWDNDLGGVNGPGSGPFATNYTKCWMQELGVRRQYLLTRDFVFT